LPGVGERTERSLWRQGCESWEAFLEAPRPYSLGSASREVARREIQKSQRALADGEHQYFRKRLRSKHVWRAYEAFADSCAYLDIETDGSARGDSVTVIGLYDGDNFQAFTKHEDLENFRDAITRYSMIVTFFGTGFDVPMLLKRFPGITMDQIHVDLCPLLRSLGIKGGLKKIEKEFGIQRSEETDGLTGYDAVLLWRRAERGDADALRLLVEYNREDVVNLKPLAEIAFSRMRDTVLRDALS
jgi:uncharacterized protein